jgi:tripartite-type tricarboxylate transporter receptor subunit TctC
MNNSSKHWGDALRIVSRIAAAAAIAVLAAMQPALARDYPAHSIRLIVGYPAGGSADIVARMIAQALSERLGQTAYVDNKPGAGWPCRTCRR